MDKLVRPRVRIPSSCAAWIASGTLIVLVGLLLSPVVGAQETSQDVLENLFEQVVGHKSGMHYTWRDESGDIITLTAITPTKGDTYIAEDNRLYEVVSVADDRTVEVTYVETVTLPRVVLEENPGNPFSSAATAIRPKSAALPTQSRGGGNNQVVGIYHSHNAESYLKSSGTEFIEPHGEVLDVGQALAEALEKQGLTVIHSDASHLPHDGGAYQRSRATVRELLAEDAVALIDVHRDAIPAEEYVTEVDGEPMTKIRLVVGRQNPNREANLELAERIKAIADERYPGLVKGIFHAAGNYNQDVGPRMILLEFGTHETSVEEATDAARLFAEVYPAAAGLTPDSAQGASRQLGGAGLRSALWFGLLAAASLFGYLWVNEGSPQAAWDRIRTFIKRESGRTKSKLGGDEGDSP